MTPANSKCYIREMHSVADINFFVEHLFSLDQLDCGDPSSICFISKGHLLKLKCTQLDYVEIEDKQTRLKIYRRVFGLPEHKSGGITMDECEFVVIRPHQPCQKRDFLIKKINFGRSSTASEIKVRKLWGLFYPNADIEDFYIQQYFSSPRLVNVGELLVIPVFESTEKSSPLPNSHLLSPASCLYYYIDSTTLINSPHEISEPSNQSPTQIRPTISCPEKTRIILAPESEAICCSQTPSPLSMVLLLVAEFMWLRGRYSRNLQQLTTQIPPTSAKNSHIQMTLSPPPLGLHISLGEAMGDVFVTCQEVGCLQVTSERLFPTTPVDNLGSQSSGLVEHLELVTAHRKAWKCGCSRCCELAYFRALAGSTMVQAVSQADAMRVVEFFAKQHGAMCVYRPLSTLEMFGSNTKIPDSKLTGFVSPGYTHEINILKMRCPVIVCITDIHVIHENSSTGNISSNPTDMTPSAIHNRCLKGLVTFVDTLMTRLYSTLVKEGSGYGCKAHCTIMSSASDQDETTEHTSDFYIPDYAQLLTIVGFTHQQNLINTNVDLREIFQHEVTLPSLSEADVYDIVSSIFDSSHHSEKDCTVIANRMKEYTHALGRSHLEQFLNEVRYAQQEGLWNLHTANGPLLTSDVSTAETLLSLDRACAVAESSVELGGWLSEAESSTPLGGQSVISVKQARSESAGSNKMLAVQWSDIGGLEKVREGIMDTLLMPKKFPGLFSPSSTTGMAPPRQTGILLFGPPGSGKTMVAKAVATECEMNFISIKGPELLDMYVGESEKHIRDLFARAKREAPCVLFFDELDSLAPCRSKQGAGGGVMDRVVSQLLTEIDSLQNTRGLVGTRSGAVQDQSYVFIIGATNRPDLLDPALLRPGRLDKKIYLGPCESDEAKLQVIAAQTKKFNLAEGVNHAQICSLLHGKFVTGADIGAFTSRAYSLAMERLIKQIEDEVERELCGAGVTEATDEGYINTKQQAIMNYINRIAAQEEELKVTSMSDSIDTDVCTVTNTPINRSNSSILDVWVTLEDFMQAAVELKPAASESDMQLYREQKLKYDSL